MSAFDSLAHECRWVAWRNERRGPEGKLTKVPYAPDGRKAKADDPATWGERRAAKARAAKLVNGLGGGVGIELGDLGADTFLAGVDLDSCLSEDGRLEAWAAPILETTETYSEISPSGCGLKLFFCLPSEAVRPLLDRLGALSDQWGVRRDIPGHDARDHGPAVEIYFARRYFAVTGRKWPDAPDALAMLDDGRLERLAGLIPAPRGANAAPSAKGDNSRSAVAFRKGAALQRAGATFDEMCAALRRDPETSAWCREKGEIAGARELRRIWEKAEAAATVPKNALSLGDFLAYMPQHAYIFRPARAMWPGPSVNARVPPVKDGDDKKAIPASVWLDANQAVEQMTWAPGEPEIIEDRLIHEGGWLDRQGARIFNLYLPPQLERGDPAAAGPWLDHLRFLYPEDAEHLLDWLAHRVQKPQEKINHAIVLGGSQGVGKDTLLDPLKYAVGPWNFQDESPTRLMGRFNAFLKAAILRVNEARDLGESDRFKFYEHIKSYLACPPETLRIDEKHLREYQILNCVGVIITSNHKTDGIFLPADDRRHFVAWCERTKEDECFQGDYFPNLWRWYEKGGRANVAAFLAARDLSRFDPKAPPPKTAAFWAIVDANAAPEEAELADLLDAMGRPDAFPLDRLRGLATGDFADWLGERKNRRVIPHRLDACGYAPVRNPNARDGLWKILGKRQTVYARNNLTLGAQVSAARNLV